MSQKSFPMQNPNVTERKAYNQLSKPRWDANQRKRPLDARFLRFRRLDFQEQVSSYLHVLQSALSVFQGVVERAEEIKAKELEQVQSMDQSELIEQGFIDEPDDLIEMAISAGEDYLVHEISLRQGIVNLFAVGLYHLFEQQIAFIYKLNVAPLKRDVKVHKFVEAAKSWDIDVTSFASWREIEELGNVANCAKHGEGRACDKLRDSRPDLLGDAASIDHGTLGLHTLGVTQPLFGEHLRATEEDLARYGDGIKKFWKEFESVLGEAVRSEVNEC